ncbi:hypothetical protein DSECCO2_538220 [anaerobic digester metagenome]
MVSLLILRRHFVVGGCINVMEAVERGPQLGEKFECSIGFGDGIRILVSLAEGEIDGGIAERVGAIGAEAVPIGGCKTQVLFHRLAGDHLLSVVIFKSQRVFAALSLKLNLADPFKILLFSNKILHDILLCKQRRHRLDIRLIAGIGDFVLLPRSLIRCT